ncbi:MAG: outer membrane protein assembly factor BamA [Helicobacteraceae bacterium]|jgi:outer membrane protein insertion porin family|nr:outer membrane protein assembly factor BamA [Helicobacteraceae bacterium]
MRIIVLFISFAVLSFAKIYNQIRFDGLARLSPQTATEIIGFSAGANIDEKRLNEAIRRLFAQEYFTDISADEPSSGVLRFTFVEKPVIARITFKGMSETERDDKYMPVFGIKKGEIYDLRRIEAAKKRLVALAQSEGYYDTLVEVEPTYEENRVYLEVTYAKGSQITIAETRFNGAKSFDKKDLQKKLANKEAQFMGWFPGRSNGALRLLELPYDSSRLRDFYLSKGYLDVEVGDPFLRADFDDYFATLEYEVIEGDPYDVDKITIGVADRKVDLTYLIQDLKLQPMRRFDIEKMRSDVDKIFETAAQDGYAFARVSPDIRKDERKRLVSVDYRVTYGQIVRIRNVIVSGNNRTLDRVIRREVFLAPGDLYNLVDLRESKAAIRRLGYFESVEIEERRVSESEMDLIVVVKETSTGSLMVGGGYSTYDGVIVNASINDRNLFGSGFSYSLGVDTSKRTRRYEVSLTNPRVRDSAYSLSFSLYDTHYEATTYIRDTQGGSATVSRRFGRNWRGGLTGSSTNNKNEYDDPDDFYVNGRTTKLSLTPFLSFDNTDDYFVPRSGVDLSQSVEIAGFDKDEEYTRTSTSLAFYYGFNELIDYDLIFRYRARFQYADADINDVKKYPIGSRLFLGGTRSLRGYQSGSVAPYRKDASGVVAKDKNGDPRYIGGAIAFNNSVEFSIPLVEEANMRFVVFYDFGAIGEKKLDMRRSSYGAAIEWISPMGPLQFIWAVPIDDKPEDTISNFEFTLGQKF